ncbi:MAG: hypothetical protein AAFO75_05340 [Pseudomonadota bacterium]
MRWVVYGLAALVGLKFYMQDVLHQSGTANALIAAYGDRAVSACQKHQSKTTEANVPELWTDTDQISVTIGRENPRTNLWDIDHPSWSADYQQPYLVVGPADRHSPLICTFDFVTGTSQISSTG